MKIKNWGEEYEVTAHKAKYYNGNLAITLTCDNGEPYGTLTKNLDEILASDKAYIDTNNLPDAERFIKENNLGKFTGLTKKCGYCEYPLYQFYLNRLENSEI